MSRREIGSFRVVTDGRTYRVQELRRCWPLWWRRRWDTVVADPTSKSGEPLELHRFSNAERAIRGIEARRKYGHWEQRSPKWKLVEEDPDDPKRGDPR